HGLLLPKATRKTKAPNMDSNENAISAASTELKIFQLNMSPAPSTYSRDERYQSQSPGGGDPQAAVDGMHGPLPYPRGPIDTRSRASASAGISHAHSTGG